MGKRTGALRVTAAVLAAAMALGGCGNAASNKSAGGSGAASDASSSGEASVKQLSLDEIKTMNNDSQATYTTVDDDKDESLRMLIGKWYDGKIENADDALKSVKSLYTLMGFDDDTDINYEWTMAMPNGYTYYAFQQMSGKETVNFAALKVIADGDGNACAIDSSFANAKTMKTLEKQNEQDNTLDAKGAEEKVAEKYPDAKIYSDDTEIVLYRYDEKIMLCFVVYTDALSEDAELPYMAHYVNFGGTYLSAMPTATRDASVENDYAATDTDRYFENLEPAEYTGTVKLHDETEREITVPVAKSTEDGKYYLCDLERNIRACKYVPYEKNGELQFISTDGNEGWSDKQLLIYESYIKVYDYFAEKGYESIDGTGELPILICMGMVDNEGDPVNNATFAGVKNGWAVFNAAELYYDGECIDSTAHEYTHGITTMSMLGINYSRESGAMNEAYSDIIGNLVEMILGTTTDDKWLIDEVKGVPLRSMSDPNEYRQPAFAGDTYYVPDVKITTEDNDNGGVHTNSGMLNNIAYKLHAEEGMPLEDEFNLWFTTFMAITPESTYFELNKMLDFTAVTLGLESYVEKIDKLFKESGVLEEEEKEIFKNGKDGCGRVTLEADKGMAATSATVKFYTPNEKDEETGKLKSYDTYVGRSSIASALLPEGNYACVIVDEVTSKQYIYTGKGWQDSILLPDELIKECAFVEVADGKVTELAGPEMTAAEREAAEKAASRADAGIEDDGSAASGAEEGEADESGSEAEEEAA